MCGCVCVCEHYCGYDNKVRFLLFIIFNFLAVLKKKQKKNKGGEVSCWQVFVFFMAFSRLHARSVKVKVGPVK